MALFVFLDLTRTIYIYIGKFQRIVLDYGKMSVSWAVKEAAG